MVEIPWRTANGGGDWSRHPQWSMILGQHGGLNTSKGRKSTLFPTENTATNYFHGGFSVAMLIFPNFSGWKLLRMDQYIRDTSEISHENIPYLI